MIYYYIVNIVVLHKLLFVLKIQVKKLQSEKAIMILKRNQRESKAVLSFTTVYFRKNFIDFFVCTIIVYFYIVDSQLLSLKYENQR